MNFPSRLGSYLLKSMIDLALDMVFSLERCSLGLEKILPRPNTFR